MKNRLGIGYISCDFPERVAKTFSTIPKGMGELVVVNSGCILPENIFDGADKIIQSGKKVSVSVAKNRALRHLMNEGCEHLFLIEDDVIINDPAVFGAYLKASEGSGIWHLNYALQGAMNRLQDITVGVSTLKELDALNNDSTPAPRSKLEYSNGSKLAFYPHAIGAFQYFYKGIIKNVGYFDERYTNAFENVDYIYRVIKKGLHPPFGWFADIENSSDYLDNIPDCMTNSVIRDDENFGKNILFGKRWFKGKFDITPDNIPDTQAEIAIKRVNELKFKYARSITND